MNKKTFMLPHTCQKAGWWMLLASLASGLIFVLIDSGSVEDIIDDAPPILAFLGTGLPFLSLMLICLSQEKEEDEYIQSLRARSIFIVVAYDFVVNMTVMSLNYVITRYLAFSTLASFHYVASLCTNLPLLIVVYLTTFKGTLLFNRIKMRHDRQ